MRTLIVSIGWMVDWDMARARAPASTSDAGLWPLRGSGVGGDVRDVWPGGGEGGSGGAHRWAGRGKARRAHLLGAGLGAGARLGEESRSATPEMVAKATDRVRPHGPL